MPADVADHYRRLIGSGPSRSGGLESTGAGGEPDLSDATIRDRLGSARAELARIVKEHLGDQPALHALADRIVDEGGDALRLLRDDEPSLGARPDLLSHLEAIVRVDGSRPSFMIRNGQVDRSTSPVGGWGDTLDAAADLLEDALECVGRINLPGSEQGFEGTGFLIHDNLLVTNRHVLQAIGAPTDGTWTIDPAAHVDFGHEFRAQTSLRRRRFASVAFCGKKPIKLSGPVDHSKLDLAVLELEPAAAADRPRRVLAFDAAPDWAQPQQIVFTVGYPANPGLVYSPTLLEQLFQSTFGCKRLAPGIVMPSQIVSQAWTFAHDTTTLGGNSGSLVFVVNRGFVATGLHYGGRRGEPRENWGHILGSVLEETDARTGRTLREILAAAGVAVIDRAAAGAGGTGAGN